MTATVSPNAVSDAVVENGTKNSALASQDVGLLFVREYYTFLNKNPQKLYGFYGKDSLMVRGDEGKPAATLRGQEEIRKKIDDLGFHDCRVLVTQVDSQVSMSDGLIVQVLGEMCNRDGPVQKFSQTFFLAPQPNGFYVLNDVFRYLKDDVDIDYYTCEDKQLEKGEDAAAESNTVTTESREAAAATTVSHTTTEAVELDSTAATTASTPVIETATPAPEEEEEEKKQKPKEEPRVDDKGEVKSLEKKPNTPTTWANMAARNEVKPWGGAAPATPEPKSSPASTTTTTTTAPPPSKPTPAKNHEHREPVPKEEMTDVFLKYIKNLTTEQVREAFTSEFGEVKSVSFHSGRNSGFLSFVSPEACQKALGQRKVTVGETVVVVEERRPSNKFNRPNGAPFERKFPQNQHRRGGGPSRGGGGGGKSRGGGNQK
ncbi:hypothetical protein BJV82DRAFT_593453 [Fennellomyces sp. T-0311]|nr:hypothetical protein BJV82DRAFT_593453 [Fennellomyces sp. T-0311]